MLEQEVEGGNCGVRGGKGGSGSDADVVDGISSCSYWFCRWLVEGIFFPFFCIGVNHTESLVSGGGDVTLDLLSCCVEEREGNLG